ncbi:MAG: substrate-binding domain-containing protein [Burkholderiales bacterium]|nr:substrate-binding domain-containing protein [Burkholderiales bacterium]
MRHPRWLVLAVALVSVNMLAPRASAQQIGVLSAGAAKEAVLPLAEAFARRTGARLAIDFGTMGLIQEKLKKGETPDVLVLSEEVAAVLAAAGTIRRETIRPLARVGIGVAVGSNAPAPDISTAEAFRRTLLAAQSIVMIDPARGTSGKHLVEVYAKLGITEALKAKMRYGPGGYIVEPVGRGEVELGLHQISEILPVKGVKLVGPLPQELQKWTTYVAAITPSSKVAEVAAALIADLASPQARATYLSKGFVLAE